MSTNINTLVEKYIAIRDTKSQIAAEPKAVMDRISNAMKKIEERLLDEMNTLGTESMRTPSGTCYKSITTSAKVEDREAFMDFVRGNNAWDFIESRANKTAVSAFLEEHQELPPGVSVTRASAVNIRRS